MLVRIESVAGLGLLHDARGAALKLESRALIYAGNGRGKSTLASILRSCATGDANILQDRVTIDGTEDPRVVLQFDAGHRVMFEQNRWSEQRPEIVVYDSDFVERNVHSGTEITSEHRKNLLDFALGDSAVQAKTAEETASSKQRQATARIRQLSSQIEAHAGSMNLPVFIALKPVVDAETKREKIVERLSAANRASSILQQPMPAPIEVPSPDIEGLFATLRRTLEDVHLDAEAAVDAHVASVGEPLVVDWLRQGQRFDDQKTCPYCGQSTHGIPLIDMYQSFFNAAYEDLLTSVKQTAHEVDFFTHPARWEEILKQRSASNERSQNWALYADVNLLDASHDELAQTSLENLRDLLVGLVSRKILAVTEAVGTEEERAEALRLWQQFSQVLLDANDLVEATRVKVAGYKASLESEDPAKIQLELDELDAAVTRHSPPVTKLVQDLNDAETNLKDAEKEKNAARAALTAQMTQTLNNYRADINTYLANLSALFSIDEIKTNFLGGGARTDYGIRLLGKPVKLTGGTPSFATALSEGDKRTMAFAFFVASTLRDPRISEKIVVIDDPMSSLDKARRDYTTELLQEIADKCRQLIVLAHDAVYLRDLRKALVRRDDQTVVSTMQISRTTGAYSKFTSVDLDRECESVYYTNYRTVDDFVQGKTDDEMAAAVAMRPLLEGYLHRRYPGHISADIMLGAAIDQIDKAPTESPLVLMQGQIEEIRSLNSFAGTFHHDTNPDFASVRTDPESVAAYGRRVLNLIHGGP